MIDKKTLRMKFSDIRAGVPDKNSKDAIITRKIYSIDAVKNADCVLLYASFRSEFDTSGLFEALRNNGIKTAFPICEKDGEMTFRIVGSKSQLSEGSYGIPEPEPSLPKPVLTNKTVCIVPGLAFTEQGGRLGYGGGFYDRFAALNPQIIMIAAAYEALMTNSLPLLQHDLRVKYIVTEERIVPCNE